MDTDYAVPLPRFEGTDFQNLRVPSIAGRRHYRVDLVNYTCTCPEFPHRLDYPIGNRHRACPHIKIAVERFHPGFFSSALHTELASMAEHEGAAFVWFPGSDQIAIAHKPGNEWCDVYEIANYRYERFGYSLPERRWSYNNSPVRGDEIATFIEKWVASDPSASSSTPQLSLPQRRGLWQRILAAFGAE